MSVFLSPGVYDREIDFSTTVVGPSTNVTAMIGGFRKGPVMERTLVTSGQDFIRKFGIPHPDSYAGLAALQYLTYGRQLWIVRIAGDSVETASVVVQDNGDDAFTVTAGSPGTWANNHLKFRVSNVESHHAEAQIGEGEDGVINIKAIEPGVSGNDFNVVVDNSTETIRTLNTTLSTGTLTIELATEDDGVDGVQLKTAENTATIIAGEINAYEEFEAEYSGDGSASLTDAENVVFTGGAFTTFKAEVIEGEIVVESQYDVHFNADSEDGKYIEDAFANSRIVEVEVDSEWTGESVPEGTYTLSGGVDGIDDISLSDKINGVRLFKDSESFLVNLITAPGYHEPALINEMLQICEVRGDCMAIIDPPFFLNEQEVVEWHNGEGQWDHQAFNSSYGALYHNWLEVYDAYHDTFRWVPPSGFICGAYAYNDHVGEPWFAPAGFIRGRLLKPTRVYTNPNLGHRDFMYSEGNAVNPIVNFSRDGITIWGQRTLQRRPSATDRVNVRRLMLYIRRAIVRSTRYFVFEPNDERTWLQWKAMVTPFLESVQSRRGLYDFRVVMDNTTVTPEDIDNNRMPGKVLVKPTRAAEFIPIDFVIYKTGVSFEE